MAAIQVQYIDTPPYEIEVTVVQVEGPMFGDFDPEYADSWERANRLEVANED